MSDLPVVYIHHWWMTHHLPESYTRQKGKLRCAVDTSVLVVVHSLSTAQTVSMQTTTTTTTTTTATAAAATTTTTTAAATTTFCLIFITIALLVYRDVVVLLAAQQTCDSQVAGSSTDWAPLRSDFGHATHTCVPLSPHI